MNGTGKSASIRANSVPVYRLVGKDGFYGGLFRSAIAAAEVARRTWPDQEQDEESEGRGWDIETVR